MLRALLVSVLLAPALGYSTPPGIYRTANYREAAALSERIVQDANAAFSIPGSVVFEEGKCGLPVCKLTHKNGGTAEVYIFGACVASW